MRADVVARAMRLIRDGIVDREGVEGLARRLGYSTRQLNRLVTAEVGTGPLALARAQRSQTARILLETTDLPVAHVAFAAGFASVRQCNETVRQIFADTPSGLRARAARSAQGRRAGGAGTGGRRGAVHPAAAGLPAPVQPGIGARLPRSPRAARRRVARRLVVPPEPAPAPRPRHRHPVRADGPRRRDAAASDDGGGPSFVEGDLVLSDLRDLTTAVSRCRQLLDLDADPVAVWEALRGDALVGPVVEHDPGRRVPGAADGFELAVRAVIGQQVSVSGARTVAGRLVQAAGDPLPEPAGSVTHLFPTPAAAGRAGRAGPRRLRHAGGAAAGARGAGRRGRARRRRHRPRRRPARDAPRAWCGCPASAPGRPSTWPCAPLRDPDAFMPTDLGIRRAARAVGLPDDPVRLAGAADSLAAVAQLRHGPPVVAPPSPTAEIPTPPMKGRAA